MQIVLIGQPELKEIFEKKELRQLSQRVTARFHLDHLTLAESRSYIKHRLAIAGTQYPIFPDKTVKSLYKISQGIPRLINVIADRALLGSYVRNQHQVSVDILRTAAIDVMGRDHPQLLKSGRRRKFL